MSAKKDWYWLAVNGASVAMCGYPVDKPSCIPTPEMFLGLPTSAEAREVQQFLLTAPLDEVKAFMTSTMLDKVKSGLAVCLMPKKPQPPTTGETVWLLEG